jgi:hypothetical protein|nr:MAG TPA: protein of unknown function (DUF4062) [Caudoviricetes sp.]
MNKIYQVFISSTYQDLIEERQKVIEALLGKNCFPVGMEYFSATNDAQFTVIKKLIDRCDYFILIIGGRYGSIEPKSGKSYTQLEFEYASSIGIPMASFYHAEPHKLPGDKIESTDAGKHRLEEFKKIVQLKLCNSWKEPYELALKVVKSLDYLFENSSRLGWVRSDSMVTENSVFIVGKEKDIAKLDEKISLLSKRIVSIEKFNNNLRNIIKTPLEIGSNVRICEGNFEGVEGKLVAIKGEFANIHLALDGLGVGVLARVPIKHIECI